MVGRLIYFGLMLGVFCLWDTACSAEKDHHPPDEWLPFIELQADNSTNNTRAKGAEEWYRIAQETLEETIARQQLNLNKAKNVIIMIGDGMNLATVTAARILQGLEGDFPDDGEENFLAFDRFPHVAFAKTYNADWQTGDSAATATAILCGVKCDHTALGVDDTAEPSNCSTEAGARVDSILYWAEQAAKSTGVVTTTTLTHATPASAYASSVSRYWECDSDQSLPDRACPDIAKQFITKGVNISVFMGGGRPMFFPNDVEDPEEPGLFGYREDGRNLINEWVVDKVLQGKSNDVVYNKADFDAVDPASVDNLLGIFQRSHLSYDFERPPNEPSLAEMTEKAIGILQKDPDGFFLMVEGGQIDFAHHDSQAAMALRETIAFSDAVEKAVNMTDESDTLIIVTADHGHAFTFGGYNRKGMNPLETSIYPARDLWPYTVLGYFNGPGFDPTASSKGRENLRGVDTTDEAFVFHSGVPRASDSHGGDDMLVRARGPMAHLMHGVQEQHYIAHMAGYAACIGPYVPHCHVG